MKEKEEKESLHCLYRKEREGKKEILFSFQIFLLMKRFEC